MTTKLLESESPRVANELRILESMGVGISTLEPVPVYLGRGTRVAYSRRLSNLPLRSVSRNFVPMYTLPVGSWSAEGNGWQRAMLVLVEPVLICVGALLLLAKSTLMVFKLRPDFVFALNAPDTGPLVVRMVTALTGTPYVYACRDPAPLLYSQIVRQYSPSLARYVSFSLDKVESLAAKGAQFVLTVGEAMSRYFLTRYGLTNCVAVYGSVPVGDGWTRRRHAGRRPFTMVLSGTVGNKVFDIDLLVASLSRCISEGRAVRLKVIGSVEPDVKARLDLLGEAVEVVGWRPWEEYMRALGDCDAGVIPLRPTEFSELVTPNKLLDFLAAGLPVVGPRMAGISEVVEDGVNGALYSPGSEDSLCQAISSLIDPEARSRMAEASRGLFESKYNQGVQTDKFRVLVRQLIR